jgi:cell wall-associated NlpC family hydrolase
MTDPRLIPILDGLAARALEGQVAAARYADPTLRQVAAPAAGIRKAPDGQAEQLDQLLFGERFEVLSEADGWAFGQARRDGYVGYVRTWALGEVGELPTHRVSALRTYGFSGADIKSTPLGLYSLNALITVIERQGRFARDAAGGWFVAEHLAPIGVAEPDFVAVAETFLGAPYQWGGRESLGLDCSGLTQQALYAAGRACPRDTDQQAAAFAPIEMAERRRGDLVFWKGHVAILTDAETILHANAHHMRVAVEPLAEALARIEAAGNGSSIGYRRP